jgi:SnoaL-like domain
MITNIERLMAVESVRVVKARYFRALDTKDWDLLRSIFCPDVACDYRNAATDPSTGINHVAGPTEDILRGADMVIESLKQALSPMVTVHIGYSADIQIDDDTHASGIWGMNDILRLPGEGRLKKLFGYGFYHDTFERLSTGWGIKTLKLSRLSVDIVHS